LFLCFSPSLLCVYFFCSVLVRALPLPFFLPVCVFLSVPCVFCLSPFAGFAFFPPVLDLLFSQFFPSFSSVFLPLFLFCFLPLSFVLSLAFIKPENVVMILGVSHKNWGLGLHRVPRAAVTDFLLNQSLLGEE
jgi:hypothetical protein